LEVVLEIVALAAVGFFFFDDSIRKNLKTSKGVDIEI